MQLDGPLLQAALLHKPDNEKLHALILLDREENVQVIIVFFLCLTVSVVTESTILHIYDLRGVKYSSIV